MSVGGWLALAGVMLALAGAGGSILRLDRLVRAGRLAGEEGPSPVTARVAGLAPGLIAAGVLGGGVVVGLLFGVLLGASAVAVLGAGVLTVWDVRRRQAQTAERAARLAAVRVLVAELVAGARPPAALLAAGSIGFGSAAVQTFAEAGRVAAAGGDAGPVLTADRRLRPVGLAWQLGEGTGVALAAVLGRVAADLSAADDQARAVAVALAGPRSSALLLTLLPVVGLGLGTAMGARPLEFLVGSLAGQLICCLGVALDLAGLLWVRRILRSAERT